MAPRSLPEPEPDASGVTTNPPAGRGSWVDTLRRDAVLNLARLVWLTMPWTTGALLGDALRPRSDAVQTTATLLAWVVWAATVVGSILPRPRTLTLVRTAMPASVPVALWATVATDVDAGAMVGLVAALIVTALVLAPVVGDTFVDGASYGDERRMLLRAPAAVLFGPLPLSWALTVGGVLGGPLLLAAHQWVVGGLVLVVGVPVAALAVRSMYQLTQRWVVFVPAGFVLHDHLALAEPSLFQKRHLRSVGPAVVGTDAADFTLGAAGLALEVRLLDPQEINVVVRRHVAEVRELDACLFTPSRPGAVMAEAARRRLPLA
jgi:hypothetical protein